MKSIFPVKNHYENGLIAQPSISKTLESLDDLLSDDDSVLLSKVESLKNFIREKKRAKEVAEKSKSDASSNDNSFSENSRTFIENGVLLDDSERKKISLRLKPTTTLRPQTKELDEPEQQVTNKSSRDKQSSKYFFLYLKLSNGFDSLIMMCSFL